MVWTINSVGEPWVPMWWLTTVPRELGCEIYISQSEALANYPGYHPTGDTQGVDRIA